jgi:hypothetical protein
MKRLLIIFTFLLSANAMADTVGDCQKLVAFRANQEAKLVLSRYGLGMISAAQLTAAQNAIQDKARASTKQCTPTEVAKT